MLSVLRLCILFSIQNTLVRCIIPALNVQKLDRALIQRKRQDTLEMCRMFNEANEKLRTLNGQNQELTKKQFSPNIKHKFVNKYNKNYNKYNKRVKRSFDTDNLIDDGNPSLDYEDIKAGILNAENEMFGKLKNENQDLEEQSYSPKKKHKFINKYSYNYNKYSRRVKRSLETDKLVGNPILDFEDVKRVEKIVDKLYDDMNEGGKRVTYRKNDFQKLTTKKTVDMVIKTENATDPRLLQSGRRFQTFPFRPAQLLGPLLDEPEGFAPKEIDAKSYIPWPKLWAHGIVPFFIDPKSYDTQLSEEITNAFDYFEKATCIRLQKLREKPRDKSSMQDVEWIYITNPSGIKQCVHSNEKKVNKGVQMVILGYECMSPGQIIHELMHVLGFSHEHTRPDRDKHLTVMWDNIKPGYKKYFELRKADLLMSLNLPYDYESVLHYPARAFSRNGHMTLVAEQGIKLGQREALSETDIAKVSLIYGAECVNRNKQYLLTTCPSVVKANAEPEVTATQQEIDDYFKDRLWPFGIVNFKLRDPMEFSAEERENIKAVISHIEKETCIEFRDLTGANKDDQDKMESPEKTDNPGLHSDITSTGNTEYTTITDNPEFTTATDNPVYTTTTETQTNTETTTTKKRTTEQGISKPPKPPGVDTSSVETDEVLKEINSSAIPVDKLVVDTSQEPSSVYAPPIPQVLHVSSDEDIKNLNAIEPNDAREEDSPAKAGGTLEFNGEPLNEKPRVKREATQQPLTPHRRHANSVLVLTRSSRSGCVCPTPGRVNGNQALEIHTDCFNSVNDLLHVFVHVLGLDHQHNMHDRDQYLHIFWANMTDEVKSELEKKLPPAAAVGFPYDYLSVTHYPWLEIKNGNINIMYPVWNDGWVMGHWQGLSSTDVAKINLLYNKQCAERKKHL